MLMKQITVPLAENMESAKNLLETGKKNVEVIERMPKKKFANRGKQSAFPVLEAALFQWVEELRSDGLIVTRNQIRLKATSIARSENIQGFTGSISWCARFMHRNNLVLRQKN